MRELRDRDPSNARLITIRTVGSEFWLIPNKTIRRLIGGIVARYQEKCAIRIYSYDFLTNHYQAVIRAPQGNADEFCENLNREIAKRVNWYHGREGPLWGRRYVDQKIIREEDLVEAVLYVALNHVHHGLVEDPFEWGGLNCVEQLLSEEERRFSFKLYSEDRYEVHSLKLSVIPSFENLSREERRAKISELIKSRVNEIKRERKEKGLGFLGMRKILEMVPGAKPRESAKSPRAPFYSKCAETIRKMKAIIKEKREAYDAASFAYRLGDLNVVFPEFTYKPPLHRVPRLVPFSPLIFEPQVG